MKYKFTKKITAMLATILVVVIFLTIPASAIEWNGSTGGGGGGGDTSNASGDYSIPYTGNYAVGYRFSRIDYYGVTKNNPIDILCSTFTSANYPVNNNNSSISGGNGYSRAKSAEWFNTKYNKVSLQARMYNPDARGTTSKTLANVYTDTDVLGGATLPPRISEIEATVMSGSVLDNVCKKLGMSGGTTDLQNGDKILVEPIFLMKMVSTDYAMTISEVGMFGGHMFGWDKPDSTKGDSGSYGFIAEFLNQIWPSTLYNTDTKFWNAGYDASVNTGGPASNAKGLISFRNLLLYGFGVGFAYNNSNPPTTPVDLYPTGVDWFTDAGGTNKVSILTEGNTYYPKFIFYNNGSIAVNVNIDVYDCTSKSYDCNVGTVIGANSYYGVMGNAVTVNKNLYFGPDSVGYSSYDYNQNLLTYKLYIYLNDTNATESNTSNNSMVHNSKFSPIQPSMSQYFLDDENSGSSWITNAVNNKIIYSGQEVKGRVDFLNRSSFSLNIVDWAKAALGLESNNTYNYLNPPGTSSQNALHGSGASWTNITGKFRAKNVPVDVSSNNSTQKTLYLLSAAGEKSYLNATGTNISNLDLLANNLEINSKYKSKSRSMTCFFKLQFIAKFINAKIHYRRNISII